MKGVSFLSKVVHKSKGVDGRVRSSTRGAGGGAGKGGNVGSKYTIK